MCARFRSPPCVLAGVVAAALAGTAGAADDTIDFRVRPGDTLIGLSRQVFVSAAAWREIARLNRLPDPNRIQPGQTLRVPTRLMRSTALAARLVSTVGEVSVGGAVAETGATLVEGQAVQTGANGSAVVELADGSRMRVPPSSLAEIVASRRYGAPESAADTGGWFAGAMRLVRGSVEMFATQIRRARPLEVSTPTAVVGVRGTHYRVALDESAATRSEVLEGRVRLDATDRRSGADLAAGFGAVLDPGADRAPAPIALPAAPDLSAVPARFERPLVRFPLAAETVPLRVQVAEDAAFDRIVSDQVSQPGTEVRIAGLPDGPWHLRARRLDARGLGGFDAARSFELKARPEPPASSRPRANAKQAVGAVEFAWARNVEAARVHLQVAADAGFAQPLIDRSDLDGGEARAELPAPGTYFWRVASVKADGDHGPFGDAQRFELRPNPEPPKGGLGADGKSIVLSWPGRPEDRQQVELARDPAFTDIVARAELPSAEWSVPTPSRSGTYYFRYRSVEPDGYVSPYSSTLSIEVPRDWTRLWPLAPLLLLLL